MNGPMSVMERLRAGAPLQIPAAMAEDLLEATEAWMVLDAGRSLRIVPTKMP